MDLPEREAKHWHATSIRVPRILPPAACLYDRAFLHQLCWGHVVCSLLVFLIYTFHGLDLVVYDNGGTEVAA